MRSSGLIIGTFALIIAIYIIWRIKQVILLAFAAVVFATIINRLVRLLQRYKIKRGAAIAISVISVLLLLAGFLILVVPPFIQQIRQLIQLVPLGIEQLRTWTDLLQNLVPEDLVGDFTPLESLSNNFRAWTSGLLDNFLSLFSSTMTVVLYTILVIVVTIMLLINPSAYRQVFILLFPAFYRRRVKEILYECEIKLSGWAVGTLFNMTVITIMSGIGLLALGVQLPLANALLAGILTFIPNVGPTLSVIPPTALALLDAPWKAIAVIILYIAIQQIESNILTPMVMKKQISLLPAITLLSQVAFAVFFGILGLFLALPIVAVGQVWFKKVLIEDILDRWQLETPKS